MNALMRCRNIDNAWHPELCNPHYFKMPNGQLVLFASDGHTLLVVKDTAGLLQKYDFDTAERPNIAAAIPTEPCNLTLNIIDLNIALRKVARACWDESETAIEIEGGLFQAKALDRLLSVLYDLDIENSVPMAVQAAHMPPTLKIETEQFIIVEAGMMEDKIKHKITMP